MVEINNGKSKWIFWLAGALWFILTTAVVSIANNVITNDKESRTRDACLEKDVVRLERANSIRFEAIMCQLSEIKTEQKYIKEKLNEE